MKCKIIRTLLFMAVLGTLIPVLAGAREIGTASWYGGKFHGRKTANGEIFDTNKFTAAHRTLPFNTMVKVTNLDNGRSVTVRINDRGPFIQGRILDLSQAAAERLDMIGTGTARVSIEVVTNNAASPRQDLLLIQVGSFSVQANAERLYAYLLNRGFSPSLETVPPAITRVVIRDVPEEQIESTVSKLRGSGIKDFFIRTAQ